VQSTSLTEQLEVERAENERLTESVGELERALTDPGWQRLEALAVQEFTPEGLRQLRSICRLYALKSPLLKRGLGLRSAYVFGQGVEITARANGREDGEQDVQQVVAAFLGDPGNKRTLTSGQARDQLEHGLGTEGELFLALFTNPATGRVQVRTIPADEVGDILCNPEDAAEPWFYRRSWTQKTYAPDGSPRFEQRELLYPCVDYRPAQRARTFGGVRVDWSAPVLHVAVNRPLHWQRGIPDAYAAVDWARAYKTFLEDWATLVKSLSRFAWRLTAKGSNRAQARTKLATAPSTDPVNGRARDVGATAITPLDAALEAIPKSGATIDSESGRPLAAMVAAALGVPVTMLLGDPGTTGNRATAETLDQPTELEMTQRRDMWTDVHLRILTHVLTEAVRAEKGPLAGTVQPDPYTGTETVTLAGDTSTVIDITWPDLDDLDPAVLVKAIVEADSTGVVPKETVLRLLLTALGVRQVDELVEEMLDPETGEFRWPGAPPIGDGPAAAAAGRAGRDPAADTGPGPMGGEDDPDADEDEDET
jgi:hypothetical protein